MPRQFRIEYSGAFYHVMARGNRRARIFLDDIDRRFFLGALGEACAMTGWRVHAWVLMGNHYHLAIETPQPNLVAGMQWLQNTYTRRFNVRHNLWGRLFGDRYKAVPVEGRNGDYYCTLLDYLHLNPARAGLVEARSGDSVRDYAWSSVAGGYALPPRGRAPWLAAAEGLEAFGLPDTTYGRRQFVERLDARVREESRAKCGIVIPQGDRRFSHLRQGWSWGSQNFADKLLALLKRGQGHGAASKTYRSAPERHAHDEQRAEEIVRAALAETGLTKRDLEKLPGCDTRKAKIAKRVKEETTVPLSWIAGRLKMRSAANVSQILGRFRKSTEP